MSGARWVARALDARARAIAAQRVSVAHISLQAKDNISKAQIMLPHQRRKKPAQVAGSKCSATGTRTRVTRVRAEYPNQLDYSGSWLIVGSVHSLQCLCFAT